MWRERELGGEGQGRPVAEDEVGEGEGEGEVRPRLSDASGTFLKEEEELLNSA